MPSRRPIGIRLRPPATRTLVALALAVIGCAVPPDYPPDEQHREVHESRTCMQCHVARAEGPRPHPSHFDEQERLKATRRECLSCHQVDASGRHARRDSVRVRGEEERADG